MAELLLGKSVSQVADENGLSHGTVGNWQRTLAKHAPPAIERRDNWIAELIVQYLEENLKTLLAQLRETRDGDWIRKQDADKVGVLHGIFFDKALRILEAAERASGIKQAVDSDNVVPISRAADRRSQQ